jgi:hypothetical protein
MAFDGKQQQQQQQKQQDQIVIFYQEELNKRDKEIEKLKGSLESALDKARQALSLAEHWKSKFVVVDEKMCNLEKQTLSSSSLPITIASTLSEIEMQKQLTLKLVEYEDRFKNEKETLENKIGSLKTTIDDQKKTIGFLCETVTKLSTIKSTESKIIFPSPPKTPPKNNPSIKEEKNTISSDEGNSHILNSLGESNIPTNNISGSSYLYKNAKDDGETEPVFSSQRLTAGGDSTKLPLLFPNTQ